MAIYDPQSQTLTLRIVYDGTGLAGKTTSLRGLASLFGRTVVSPDETLGRTLYFDWLDHQLPQVAGERVRIQLISVPGQKGFIQRRGLLLAAADAIVVVIDSTELGLPASLRSLQELQDSLAQAPEPRPAITLQVNKRDEDGALPIEELRRRLGPSADLPIFESVAISADGLIPPLSYAVHLAQQRAEALADRGLLAVGEVGVQDSDGLLAGLHRAEAAKRVGVSAGGVESLIDGSLADGSIWNLALESSAFGDEGAKASRDIRLALAQEMELSRSALVAISPPEELERAQGLLVQGGVWPAQQGPALVAEALALAASQGGFSGGRDAFLKFGPWKVKRLGMHSFSSKEEACSELREWAGRCEREKRALSAHRWLAVLPRQIETREEGSGEGGAWILWQGVRIQPSLQDLAMQRMLEENDEKVVLRSVHLAAALVQGQEILQSSGLKLRGDRHSLGIHRSRPVFIDLLPGPETWNEVHPPSEPDREIWSMMLSGLSGPKRDLDRLLKALLAQSFANPTLIRAADEVARVLRRTGETMKTDG